MPEQEAPYDPYIPSGQQGQQQQGQGTARTQALQAVSYDLDILSAARTMEICVDCETRETMTTQLPLGHHPTDFCGRDGNGGILASTQTALPERCDANCRLD